MKRITGTPLKGERNEKEILSVISVLGDAAQVAAAVKRQQETAPAFHGLVN